MFLRFRRRMLTYIAVSSFFLFAVFYLSGEDLGLRKHVDYVVDKTRSQWDFDPKSGGIKPEDGALKKGPGGGSAASKVVIHETNMAEGGKATKTLPALVQTQLPDRPSVPAVPPAGHSDPNFQPATVPKVILGQKPTKDETDAWFLPAHWERQTEKYPVVPEKLIMLPTGTPEQMPTIQAVFQAETEPEKQKRQNRQAKVKEEFRHAWKAYKAQAWTHDEVRPVSGGTKDPFCGWAATMVDALDTMWIMGLKDDFEEAVEEVSRIDFTTTPREQIPLFETTIRYLGGMIAAYEVSGGDYPVLLVKAQELAEILMGAFDTPNRMPVLYYSWKPVFAMQAKRAGSRANFAELSSLSMEFTRLAQLTGENKYYDAVARITNELVEWQKRGTKLKGVFPNNVDAQGCNKTGISTDGGNAGAMQTKPASPNGFFEEPESNVYKVADAPVAGGPANVKRSGLSEHATPVLRDTSKDWDCVPQGLTGELEGKETFSMGGGQDSGYEYFLKMHLLLGGLEPKYKQLYKGTIEAVKNYMLFRPMIPDETRSILFSSRVSTFGHPETPGDLDITYEITHLTCFIGGMVGMGAQIFKDPGELDIAKRLTDGCVYAYSATKSGIMPETARGVPCADIIDCKWDQSTWYRYLDPLSPSDRQRDVDIWDRKTAARKAEEDEAAAIKEKEAAEQKIESQANLDKDRAKLDASYAAYAYRVQPGVQPKLSAEEMVRIGESVAKYATLPKENIDSAKAGMAKDGTIAHNETNGTNGTASVAEVVANPESLASAPSTAVTAEPVMEAAVNGTEKAKRDAPLDGAATVKTGAQTAGQAIAPVEGDGKVGGAPPQAPPANPEDLINIDDPRPQTHKEYVEDRIRREGLPRGFAGMDSAAYILRPEAIESVWYMHRITADLQWAEKGWDMFLAIIRNTKTKYGHAALHNVNFLPTEKVDSMESFWLAETLKYFYLLYSEPTLISLDDWVLNTEAHPFRRPSTAAFLENGERIRKLEEWKKGKKLFVAEAAKVKAQQEEYLKRLGEIEKAKAAGAGRGGVAVSKAAVEPDSDVELRRKQEAYWKLVEQKEKEKGANQGEAAAAAAPTLPATPEVPAAPAKPVDAEAVLKKAKEDEFRAMVEEMGTPKKKAGSAAGAAAPPKAGTPAVAAPGEPVSMDLEAYAKKAKEEAYEKKLAKLNKLEADMASGAIKPAEAAKLAAELKAMPG